MRNLLRSAFPALLLVSTVAAQETVAPTSGESTMSPRGENTGAYNVVQSWEFGYRYATVGGDDGKYRSDVNFGDGIRLLSSSLTIDSRDGHNRWFDEITLTTLGLGNDPYESATLRVRRNHWYQYDLLWRSNDYFNPGLTVADGEHLEDTVASWQDHDLTILPDNWFRIRAGYSRTTQTGPALTTEQEFDTQGDVFPIFRDTRQQYNEYRIAADVVRKRFRFTVQHRWEYFRDDTTDNLAITEQGSPTDPSELTSFTRAQPYRGQTPGWLVSLFGARSWLVADGRFTYAGGRGDFIQNEAATGLDRFGNPQDVQMIVTGTGDRPVISGNLNLTLFPASRLSFTNSTSVSNTRMIGNNSYEEFNNATFTAQDVNFQFLGVRLITNSTDVRYRFTKKLNAFAGFRYSDRQIRSTEDEAPGAGPFLGISAEQSNQQRAGVAGVNWTPLNGLLVRLDTEIGRNSNPFTPISLRNYQILGSKLRYRRNRYSLGAGYMESYNNNSIQITAFSSHSRTYNAGGSWNLRSWFSVDASYSKLHLDTAGGIAFFAGVPVASLTEAESIYISNIHAVNLGFRLTLKTRADVYIGYDLTRDTGDGRNSAIPQTSTVGQLLYSVQTFPLTYQTPLLRLSVRITPKIRYNIGYQYYGYHEDFGLLSVNQSYRANTGYTSLLWSF